MKSDLRYKNKHLENLKIEYSMGYPTLRKETTLIALCSCLQEVLFTSVFHIRKETEQLILQKGY